MEKIIEVTCQSKDEAIKKALDELGVEEESVDVEVIEEKKQGFLSSNKEYKIRVSINDKNLENALKEFLENTVEKLGFEATITINYEDDTYQVDIDGDDLGLLIGKHGETIQALQTLCFAYLSRLAQSRVPIEIDIAGYFKKRSEKLIDIAQNMANKVASTGKSIALKPMTAKERRIIHLALKDSKEVVTASEGEEPYRQVLIIPRHYN